VVQFSALPHDSPVFTSDGDFLHSSLPPFTFILPSDATCPASAYENVTNQ